MMQAPDLPTWAALLVGFLLLAGAVITLIGAVGLLRLGSFYDRIHAPTLGTTGGMMAILLASMICFSVPALISEMREATRLRPRPARGTGASIRRRAPLR